MKNMKIDANGTEIRVMGDIVNEDAYISLTDIAKYKNPDNAFIVVANWMRNHSTISFFLIDQNRQLGGMHLSNSLVPSLQNTPESSKLMMPKQRTFGCEQKGA